MGLHVVMTNLFTLVNVQISKGGFTYHGQGRLQESICNSRGVKGRRGRYKNTNKNLNFHGSS